MFIHFLYALREARVPVSLSEFLAFLEALAAGEARWSVEEFHWLGRATLIKDERYLDRFDQIFARFIQGQWGALTTDCTDAVDIPAHWLAGQAERYLTAEEKAAIKALGGWERLMETLADRLRAQKERHQGGAKWIGTAGTSPFGAYGYNPEGVRIGQDRSRNRRAVKAWDQREFRELDDDGALGPRVLRLALRRLRHFARDGAAQELDLPPTIRSTANNGGWLDIKMRRERRNTVKVLLLLDAGGSMDDHLRIVSELFLSARSEFKDLHCFYFHNLIYDFLWTGANRRNAERVETAAILQRFQPDVRVVLVGDAAMSPYEVLLPGGSLEYNNRDPGQVWLQRLLATWRRAVWINPLDQSLWPETASIGLIRGLLSGRMYPLTLAGIDGAMQNLLR